MARWSWIAVSLLVCAAHAGELPARYVPKQPVSGTIGIWGHGAYGRRLEFVEGLVGAWEDGCKAHHPGIRFENRLHGTAAAIGAPYTGTGDLALMGREIRDPEIAAFKEAYGCAPTGLDVMTGSFDVRNKGYAIVVFARDNPIAGLTLAQLDAIYGAERLRGSADPGHPDVLQQGAGPAGRPEGRGVPALSTEP